MMQHGRSLQIVQGESLLCLESSFVGGMRKVKILVIPIAMIVGKLNLPGCS